MVSPGMKKALKITGIVIGIVVLLVIVLALTLPFLINPNRFKDDIAAAVKEKTGIDFKPDAGDKSWLPVEGFLDKPVKPDVLIDKVRTLLSH